MGKDSAIGPELSENILGSLVDMRGLFEHSKGFNQWSPRCQVMHKAGKLMATKGPKGGPR